MPLLNPIEGTTQPRQGHEVKYGHLKGIKPYNTFSSFFYDLIEIGRTYILACANFILQRVALSCIPPNTMFKFFRFFIKIDSSFFESLP